MAAQQTVLLGGKRVTVTEGDLLLLQAPGLLNGVLGLFGSGYSHVVTCVSLHGTLSAISVYTDGVWVEPLHQFTPPAYSKLSIVRPHKTRSSAQTSMLRLAATRVRLADAARAHRSYDGPQEFARTLFGMRAGTESRFTCSELAARLAAASHAWPANASFACRIDTVGRKVGTLERVF
jgi:hypothetical protein